MSADVETTVVHGTVAAGFEAVRAEFAAVVAEENGESGAQLAGFVHGRKVVDLWAGPEVTGETLTGLHSTTKGAATLVVALLVQDGVLELDRTVAHYWPDFAAAGKSAITLRQVLTHRAGLIGIDGGFTVAQLADDRIVAELIVQQHPHFRPGAAQGYGGFVTFAILGEVVRRLVGRSIQELFEERIRAPYELDLYLGLPEAQDGRFREILPWLATPDMEAAFAANSPSPHGIAGISYNLAATPAFTPMDVMLLPNSREVRSRGPASAGGVGSARGVASMYAAAISELNGRPPLLHPDTLAEFTAIHAPGPDLVRGDAAFALGFEAKGLSYPFLGARAFGHTGSAGSDGFADPRSGVAYGYTRRRAAFAFTAAENHRLAAALHWAAMELDH
ncbi:serine hydrolase domain-containing protein [Nocardia bhagyanarayanae]|uniref:CubicO group peptidase (Beta-lactamase class C family) n=1 Tax=Nocardia bhagyanarayanae TaxID=1215925 RepID=A0A543FCK5_9NOCA|nr:serine hydrolase domain-containing protein [Nocardia bhagyanarayanae]TQM31426.1 CubicO group peptidase (beta-lactamase class C family) [Nocardia bhagyanarayanae]